MTKDGKTKAIWLLAAEILSRRKWRSSSVILAGSSARRCRRRLRDHFQLPHGAVEWLKIRHAVYSQYRSPKGVSPAFRLLIVRILFRLRRIRLPAKRTSSVRGIFSRYGLRMAAYCREPVIRKRLLIFATARLREVGVISELMHDNGTMMRVPDLQAFAAKLWHSASFDCRSYRIPTDGSMKRSFRRRLPRTETATGDWNISVYA